LSSPPEAGGEGVDRGAPQSEETDSEAWSEELAERLAAPSSAEAIYLDEASVFRPISAGDIFRDVRVPGSTPEESAYDLTMIVAHPSAMRRGGTLEDRARAAPVVRKDGLRKSEWTVKHKPADYFPLPLLTRFAKANGFDIEDLPWGANLQLAAPVPTSDLDVRRRVVCLSREGVHILLQQLSFADTRVVVKMEHLVRMIEEKMEEIESLQTWNEDLVMPKVEAGGDLEAELRAVAEEFDAVCEAVSDDRPTSIHKLLANADTHGEGQRLLMRELKARREGAGS
jgi:hypothetical protein